MSEDDPLRPPGSIAWKLRRPCAACGGAEGWIRRRSGQDTVYCGSCGRHAYNAPRIETLGVRIPAAPTEERPGIAETAGLFDE